MKVLKDMEIEEVSLVDKGANQHADVLFWKKDGDMTEDVRQQLDVLKSEAAFYKAYSKLTDAEKAYMDKMEDEDMKGKFPEMTPEQRKKLMDGGKKMSKSDDTTFAKQLEDFQKQLNEQKEELAKRDQTIAKMQEENELLKLEKRAEKELAGLSGTVAEKAKLLKAVEDIADESVRKMALDNLKAAAQKNESFMKASGSSSSNEGASASETLQKRANEISVSENISVPLAYDKLLQTAEGRRLYNQSRKGN